MSRHKSPCTRDCLDRSINPNCHSFCEKYLEWKKSESERGETIFKAKNEEWGHNSGYFRDRDAKISKKINRKKNG